MTKAATVAMLGLMSVSGSHAQQISGVVSDPSGSAIAGARVTASLRGRSLGAVANSGPDGRFSALLEPGVYEVLVSADGFRTHSRTLDLRIATSPEPIDIVLELQERREVMTVTESAGYQAPVASALKVPMQLIDVPQAVTVVGRSQMRDQSMQNMADVVRYVPGITMAQGEGHRDAPVIRGNATTADFYVNGVRDDVQYMRDLYNVERVEAIKGANALTFGRGGGGGVINRVNKQAEFSPIREVGLQGGTFGNKRLTTDAGHAFGDRLAVRLNGMYEDSASSRHAVNLERYGLASAATLKVSARTVARVGYEYFHDGRTVDRGVPSFMGRPSSAHRSTFFGDPARSNSDVGVQLGSAGMERQLGPWMLRNTTLVGDYDKFYQNIFPGALSNAQSSVSISGYNNATGRRNVFNQTDVTGVASTGPIRHTILVGGELGHQRTTNYRTTAFFNGLATSISAPFWHPNIATSPIFRQAATDADNGATNRVSAAFVQDQMDLTRHVQFVAGVRYDFFDTNFLDNRTSQPLRRSDNLIAPRLGLVVKPVSGLSLYGSYGVTYLPSSGDQFASLTATTQTLRPEKFNNYEVGVKMDLKRGLSLTSSLYRLDRNNSIARDPNDPTRTVQTGSQRTNGFELGTSGNITNRWQVAGGYAAQDAFVSRPTAAAALGARVPLVPRQTFSLWNNYRVAPRLSLGLGTIHQAQMFAGIDNTVRLPSFTRADAALFVTITDTVRFQANLENAFDATYYPTAHSNNNILPGSARALRLGLMARF